MPGLPVWATRKLGPLPVWAWGGIAFTGGVAYVVYKRRASSSTASPLATGAQAVPSQYPNASGDAGGAPGGFGSDLPWTPQTGGLLSVAPSPQPQQQQPLQQQLQAPRTTSSVAPAVAISPSLLGGGYVASTSALSNPVGSADRDAAASGGLYTPSLTDYSTEQPGGIQTVQAGLPGTQPNQGLTYSIYGTNTGTGAVVPASQRVAGERYDALGRVIA